MAPTCAKTAAAMEDRHRGDAGNLVWAGMRLEDQLVLRDEVVMREGHGFGEAGRPAAE